MPYIRSKDQPVSAPALCSIENVRFFLVSRPRLDQLIPISPSLLEQHPNLEHISARSSNEDVFSKHLPRSGTRLITGTTARHIPYDELTADVSFLSAQRAMSQLLVEYRLSPLNAGFSPFVNLDQYSCLNPFIPSFEVARPNHLINVSSYHGLQCLIAWHCSISINFLVVHGQHFHFVTNLQGHSPEVFHLLLIELGPILNRNPELHPQVSKC